MAVNYDLVIVGETPAGKAAAIAAAQAYARVAWVTASVPRAADPLVLLREGSRTMQIRKGLSLSQHWTKGAEVLSSALQGSQAPSGVQSYGVDYQEGPVQFQQKDGLCLTVGQRLMRSRSYLLAMEPEVLLPKILGMDLPQVWTIPQLWRELQVADEHWPEHVTILGDGPQAVELSQSLQRLGRTVLVLTGGGPLLPQEDREAAFLLQTYLEAAGIYIDTKALLLEVIAAGQELVLKTHDCKYATDALVIATEGFQSLPFYLAPLNLKQTKQGVWVNSSLQTSQPNLYACGPLLGGYRIPSLASTEAKVTVQNALFEKRSPIQYHHIPYAILSDPPLARVGLTEFQAKRYDPQVQVLRQSFQDCDRALFAQVPAGLCKVLVQADGTMLGAHIVGVCAEELIHVFALAMRQGLRLQDVGELGYASPTFTEVIQQVAHQWQWQLWRKNRDRNERWFYNRRKWAR
jgi:pyruvate/2-oxoglutarate dehydrogenase complex dihydrolipoamide dehydrogenase (E3) component